VADRTPSENLLNTAAAAEQLSLSGSFLAKLRMRGQGPRYRKLGRAVRYAPADLDQYVAECSRVSTSDEQASAKPVARLAAKRPP
jgi:predicted DNA-binding transcriptional regulator AlpA